MADTGEEGVIDGGGWSRSALESFEKKRNRL